MVAEMAAGHARDAEAVRAECEARVAAAHAKLRMHLGAFITGGRWSTAPFMHVEEQQL